MHVGYLFHHHPSEQLEILYSLDELYNLRNERETEDDIGVIVDIYFDTVVR